MIEMYQRKRFPNQKLTANKAIEIYNKVKEGSKQKEVADIFNIDFRTVSDIALGKRWQHAIGA